MATNEIKNRLKVYLLKEFSETQYIKEGTLSAFKEKKIKDIIFNFRTRSSGQPKWYRNFFEEELDDIEIQGNSLSGYFEKKVTYNEKSYKFVISFGGADAAFNLEKFVDNFGIKVAFNICDKFVAIQKNNISTTMSNNKEYATKKDSFSAFVVDKENDLLNKVVISPKENNGIAIGNVSGGIGLNLTTTCTVKNIEGLLKKIMERYLSNDYKIEYGFLDNIKSIDNDKVLLKILKKQIIDLINTKQYEKVWFGLPLIDEWEKIESLKVVYKKVEKEYDDINIDNICEDFQICEYKDLTQIKVIPQNSYETYSDYYKLSECLYGEVEINEKFYVINGEKFYNIEKEYTDHISNEYKKIKIYQGLPKRTELGDEGCYNKSVEKNFSDTYKNLDKKLYCFNKNKIELCDLLDVKSNALIHVKKSGASSVLSHLFLQALNSAELIANSQERQKIIKYYDEKYHIKVPSSNNYNIVMAIISKSKLKENEYLNIPFFSKMSIVSVANKIISFGFQPCVAFILSEVELYNKKNS